MLFGWISILGFKHPDKKYGFFQTFFGVISVAFRKYVPLGECKRKCGFEDGCGMEKKM